MMKRVAILLSTGAVLVSLASGAFFSDVHVMALAPSTTVASSTAANEACQGLNLLGSNGCGNGSSQVNDTLSAIINVFSAIVGIVAVIMIIVSGLQFMTANGDPQGIAKARTALLYAIIGLVIVVLAQTIVHFAISQASTAT